MNDGQDLKSLQYSKILERLNRNLTLNNLVTIAIHAGERIQEFGVAGRPDYKGRGSRAEAYHFFLMEELFPFTEKYFKVKLSREKVVMTGFSLGGLSAFDFAWSYSHRVSKVGVFSGSFWWRTKALGPDYRETDRIIHQKIDSSSEKPNLRFWFQVGTLDEINDRNQNGVIDSIDDTLDLIISLKNKGYNQVTDIRYREVKGGEHNHDTWSGEMPDFLEWAFRENLKEEGLL